jgi:hypothetical protein
MLPGQDELGRPTLDVNRHDPDFSYFFGAVPDEDFDLLAGFFRSDVIRCRSESVMYVIVTDSPGFNPLSISMKSLSL